VWSENQRTEGSTEIDDAPATPEASAEGDAPDDSEPAP